MQTKNNKVIILRNVAIAYGKKSEIILKNINLEVAKNEFVAIIGPSGVGKSTLFKVFVNAINPITGQVEVLNNDFNNLSTKQKIKMLSKIGFLTQKTNLINTDNVYNNIVRSITNYKNVFYKFFGILTKQQKLNIFEKLDDLKILDKAFYKVSELSGGQQQRVEIAKLLIKDVELILADEPTASLDHQTSLEVIEILKEISKQKTVIVNIHDLDLAKKYFDRVIAINNKTIAFNKKTSDIKQWELEKIIQTKN
ncbi:ATP-binding cassette domain-containing protein [Mycoplasma putrefaciens]|uniref:ABC transporter, ATP binding protein n=1 Tax=Mycoplasma putrefaciens (strain ATCC 15718 / NCTC 10155 / C30 KS-1 / KS-1) TaxID=743965 RepID=A0A7U4E9E2_MYCPK|nr:ATP-binding cassette domain-containing protein [Mycoplasma putrefaciens]AEM68772.1 ABC transporter, ATP binding protein [Mycoplasma putrefaciens KS1]